MPKLPQVSGKQTVKALRKIGFVKISQKGSHIKLEKTEADRNITITIPNHKVLKKGTLRNGILKAIPLSVEEFSKLLKK
jgi:predicted RNA binding protein YcfA (HicA-like mRNA interferase family)